MVLNKTSYALVFATIWYAVAYALYVSTECASTLYGSGADTVLLATPEKLSADLPWTVPGATLYIITPCLRPNHLLDIRGSFPDNAKWIWIIVYGSKPLQLMFPADTRVHEVWPGLKGAHPDEPKTFGNLERNFGISLIKAQDAYVYFLDDDNRPHLNFWRQVYPILEQNVYDFVTFDQQRTPNEILRGPKAKVYHIDTAMYVAQRRLISDKRWRTSLYMADGVFAEELQQQSQRHFYLNTTCAYYNFYKQTFISLTPITTTN